MWKELEPPKRILPPGVVTLEKSGKFRFGANAVRQWHLDKFKAVKLLTDNDAPELLALQLCSEIVPKSISLRKNRSLMDFSARWIFGELDVKPGRYFARKDGGIIVIDFSKRLNEEDLKNL